MSGVRIGHRTIGPGHPVFIVAEAGLAHFGDLDAASRLVEIAADAGADAVKFQIYRTDALIATSEAAWRQRLKSKELRYEDFKTLQQRAGHRGILFFATPHEEAALDYLVEELGVPLLKIGSGEVGNVVFLKKVAAKRLPTMVSLGLHTATDIDAVVRVFEEAEHDALILLHCVTHYPTPARESNLRSIPWLQARYSRPVGYCDHTVGHDAAIAAVALSACVVEKHFFIDRFVEGSQDAPGACDASDLPRFVLRIRAVEETLGIEGPNPNMERMASREWAAKSVVAARSIRRGDRLTEEDLVLKRPGRGIPAEHFYAVVGRRVRRDLQPDELLQWSDLEESV